VIDPFLYDTPSQVSHETPKVKRRPDGRPLHITHPFHVVHEEDEIGFRFTNLEAAAQKVCFLGGGWRVRYAEETVPWDECKAIVSRQRYTAKGDNRENYR
jgi:hypothetical protein